MVTREPKRGDVLTVNKASEEIGIHHVTLYKWINEGKVAFVRFGGLMFIPVREVERLREEKKQKTASG